MLSRLSLLLPLVLAAPLAPASTDLPFSLDIMQHAVAACQNSYCGATLNTAGSVFEDMTLLETIPLPDDEQRTNIYHADGLGLIVAYMGTNLSSIDSQLHDVEFWHTTPDPRLGLDAGTTVFWGFQNQWQKSWDRVEASLTKYFGEYPGEKLLVTGHSMGASMCQLAALAIRKSFGDEVIGHVIALEPPRTGSPSFAKQFDNYFSSRYTGVTNGLDWVPRVPPRILNYEHPSNMVWIHPANSTTIHYFTDGEDPRGPNSDIPIFLNIPAFEAGDWKDLVYWGDHQGQLFGVGLETELGNCPVSWTVNSWE